MPVVASHLQILPVAQGRAGHNFRCPTGQRINAYLWLLQKQLNGPALIFYFK